MVGHKRSGATLRRVLRLRGSTGGGAAAGVSVSLGPGLCGLVSVAVGSPLFGLRTSSGRSWGRSGSTGWITFVPSWRDPGMRRGWVTGVLSRFWVVSRVDGHIFRRWVRVRNSVLPDPSHFTRYCLFSKRSTTSPVRSYLSGWLPLLF